MKVKDITKILEDFAPLNYQESYDNSGLIVGDYSMELKGVLISLDITEEVIDEAIKENCNMIVSHHPIIFSGLKSLTGANFVERSVIKAIKNNIALYASHTNADSVFNGVSGKMCEKLELQNCSILSPRSSILFKIVVFVPYKFADKVKNAMYKAGAGEIGNYSECSFSVEGNGTFKANESASPFVGEKDLLHTEPEQRVEVIVPEHAKNKVISALIYAHPYEEVAYDVYKLENKHNNIGFGMIGDLKNEMDELEFLNKVKEVFNVGCVKYTSLLNKPIKKVALCGGSGSFLLNNAIANNADIFITGDFKYHDFFNAENKIIIADIGHFESEQFTKNIFYDIIKEKMPTFAVRLSNVNTNPIKYL